MRATYITAKDFFPIVLASFALGRSFSVIQGGNQESGFLGFFVLFSLSLLCLKLSYEWAKGGATLGVIIALAFLLRRGVGEGLYIGLTLFGD